ncbi:MAG: transposase [Oscillospiraceae bacterium]|jgi:hypothetical protein|nr:transposase [Oscillospiraceae bacterium]
MQQIGSISAKVITLLDLSVVAGAPIYLGASNIMHMQQKHPADYMKYGADIPGILAAPDYVGLNPTDNSIEYVKEYLINGEFVKVAVRVTASGRFYARSIYALNRNRVQNFIRKGTLKRT